MFRSVSFLAVLLSLSIIITGCPPDPEEGSEGILTSKQLPEPDWMDNRLLIKAGRFKTADALLAALKDEGVIFDPDVTAVFSRDLREIPMEREEYGLEVAVVSLLDIGLHPESTVDEIRKRCYEHGLRPLTTEEAGELRLQFLNQWEVPYSHGMHVFFTLPPEGVQHTFKLYRSWDDTVTQVGMASVPVFDYHEDGSKTPTIYKTTGYPLSYKNPDAVTGSRFAGAFIE